MAFFGPFFIISSFPDCLAISTLPFLGGPRYLGVGPTSVLFFLGVVAPGDSVVFFGFGGLFPQIVIFGLCCFLQQWPQMCGYSGELLCGYGRACLVHAQCP